MNGNIRERIYHLETPPPAGVWERIAHVLDEDEQQKTPVIPITGKNKTNWLKMALAASLVGFVAMTGLWLAERGAKKEKEMVRQNTIKPAADTLNKKGNEMAEQKTAPVLMPQDSAALPPKIIIRNVPVYITRDNPGIKKIPGKDNAAPEEFIQVRTNPSQTLADNNHLPRVVARDSSGKAIQDIGVVRSANETNAAGPLTRGDKSIAQMLSKISVKGDNEELDRIISDSPYWKNKIQEWRNKLIRSGYSPSAVNMMDIPELLKVIQEEKTP